jgi:hypothetical protein
MNTETVRKRLASQGALVRVDEFVAALSHHDWRVRRDAIDLSSKLQGRTDVAEALLVALRNRDDIALRNAAVHSLARVGGAARAQLCESLPLLDVDTKKLACEVLAQTADDASVTALILCANDAEQNVRTAAIEGLAGAQYASENAMRLASAALYSVIRAAGAVSSVDTLAAALTACSVLGPPLGLADLQRFVEEESLARLAILAAEGTSDPKTLEFLVDALERRPHLAAEVFEVLSQASLRYLESGTSVPWTLGPGAVRYVCEAAKEGSDATQKLKALLVLAAVRNPQGLEFACEFCTRSEHPWLLHILAAYEEASLLRLLQSSEAEPGAVGWLVRLSETFGALSAQTLADVVSVRIETSQTEAETEALLWLLSVVNVRQQRAMLSGRALLLLDRAETSDALARPAVAFLMGLPESVRDSLCDPGNQGGRLSQVVAFAKRFDAASGTRTRTALVLEAMQAEEPLLRELGTGKADPQFELELEALQFAVLDDDLRVAEAAVSAFAVHGCVAELEHILASRKIGFLRSLVVHALGRVAPERLMELASTERLSSDVRFGRMVLDALKPIVGAAQDFVFPTFERAEPEFVVHAVRALGPLMRQESLERVTSLFLHSDPAVRIAASRALAISPHAGAREGLRAQLSREEDPDVFESLRATLRLAKLR